MGISVSYRWCALYHSGNAFIVMSKRLASFLHNLAIFSHGLVYVGVLVYEAYVVD